MRVEIGNRDNSAGRAIVSRLRLFSTLLTVFIALYRIPNFDAIAVTLGIGGIVLGFVALLLGYWRRQKAASDSI